MKTNKLLLAMVLGTGGTLLSASLATTDARAQGATTGAISGLVSDQATGEPLAGVTVVATSGQASQTAITEDNGTYKITDLAPGDYLVTFFFGDVTIERRNIRVGVQKATPLYQKINTTAAVSETIVIDDKPPAIDPTSTSQGITIDQEYTKNIPVPGRTFASALGAAAGSQGDALGVAFSGSSSLENQYYVDGVNTTSLRYGTVGSAVLNDFIEETEVITGGYNAEYGRATGAVVNVVTRSGTNELEGTVFAYLQPGILAADPERTPTQASSIDAVSDPGISTDVGALVSGPVIKDKLWFVIAAAPSYAYNDIKRTTKRQVDCDDPSTDMIETPQTGGCVNANGPDIDPDTGFRIYEDLATRSFRPYAWGVSMLGKLNYALSPEHQGQVSFQGGPGHSRTYAIYGTPQAGDFESDSLTTDLSGKWTSKFNDNKTEVEAVVGWHRDANKAQTVDPAARMQPREVLLFGNLGEWSKLGAEDQATMLGCTDGGNDDPYPAITNCPDRGVGYRVGGGGGFDDTVESRIAGKLSLTQRLKALGTHEIKAGIDGEVNTLNEPRVYTGGVFYQNRADTKTITAYRWVQVAPSNTTDPSFDKTCSYTPVGAMNSVDIPCRYIEQGGEGSEIEGETINYAAYLRDSWQVRPNLTLNAGLRYEEQRLRYAKFLRDDINPNTGAEYGTNAMSMRNMWAPRVGVLYDWTREGRSKVYGHWGRFYESIPMDINSRSFGGEVSMQQDFDWRNCGASVPGYGGPSASGCPADAEGGDLIGVGGTEVAPGVKPQYLDESIFGIEYELMEDLKLGLAVQSRALKRVIEDVSTDGAATYIIANPGEWSQDEEDKLQAKIDAATAAGDTAEVARLNRLMRLFTGIRIFDKPERRYDALQFTATRRFSKSLYMQASYTYSRTTGNYPGLISYDNGQVDPNISSQYDLIELLSNRQGPLPQDRPHYIKLDGYYQIDFKKAGRATLGWRARALSGVPRNALAGHPLYGIGESFLLPRGEIGRTNFETSLDLHVGYARKLAKGMELEIFADLYNVLNDQGTFSVDEDYSYRSDANPIVGGTYEDVVFAKALDTNGFETPEPLIRNPNFGNTAGRYSPLYTRFGARLDF